MGRYVRVLELSELPSGSIASVDVEEKHILLANVGGEVFAMSGYCTHEETDLGTGFMIEDRVVCPLHLSQFDLRTGEVYNPPATEPLKRYNVKIEGNDIFVEI